MALQPYTDPGQALALYQAEQISPEEQERRTKEVKQMRFNCCKTIVLSIFQKNAARHRPKGRRNPFYLLFF
jgi:hypothetical protein